MKTVCCAAALLLFACGASGGTFTPLPVLGTTQLDLDVQDGHYCGWIIEDVGSVNALRTTLQIHRRGSDPQWTPTFQISLSNGSKRVSFNIMAPGPGIPLVARVMQPGDKEDLGKFLGNVEMDAPFELAIDWSADGTITVKAGGQTVTVSLGAPVKGLKITGSTGEIEFNPLQIGTFLP